MTTSAFSRFSLALALCLSPLAAFPAGAQDAPKGVEVKKAAPSPEQLQAAQLLMEAKNARATILSALTKAVNAQQAHNPAMGEAFYRELTAEMTKKENIDELLRLHAEVMASHFSVAELQELTTFYTTPLGRRLAAEEATVSTESLQAGAKWGAEIGKRIDAKLRKAKAK